VTVFDKVIREYTLTRATTIAISFEAYCDNYCSCSLQR